MQPVGLGKLRIQLQSMDMKKNVHNLNTSAHWNNTFLQKWFDKIRSNFDIGKHDK
jgi:Cft2 family RNA processing exonuclease